MLIAKSHRYCPWSLLASQGYVCFILYWDALPFQNCHARNYPATVCVSNPTWKSCWCCSCVFVLSYHTPVEWESRWLSRWTFSGTQEAVLGLFYFIHVFQSKCMMLCLKSWHRQNWVVTVAEPESSLQWTTERAVGNLFYQMPIHICKQPSDAVKGYYLLFGGTWKALHWICSLATIPIKQERCLLVRQLHGFLIALSWQWNKNVHDLRCDSEYLVACSPDLLLSHHNPFASICSFVIRS